MQEDNLVYRKCSVPCAICGISSFDHEHRPGSDPKNFFRIEPERDAKSPWWYDEGESIANGADAYGVIERIVKKEAQNTADYIAKYIETLKYSKSDKSVFEVSYNLASDRIIEEITKMFSLGKRYD